MTAETIREVKITFLGQSRRMIEWTPGIDPEEMMAAGNMCHAQVVSIPDDEEDGE